MILLIDMDEVIVDLLGVWLPEINRRFGDNLTRETITCYEIHKLSKGGTKIYDIIKEKGLFSKPKPIKGAVETLKKLHDEGHQLFIVTSPIPDSTYVYREKLDWIAKYLPFIDLDNVVFSRKKYMVRGDLLLDDYHKHLELFHGISVGFQTRPEHYDKADHTVSSWDEFYQLVKELNNKPSSN